MFGISIWHVLFVLVAVALIFGHRRIAGLMGNLGRGVRAFRREMKRGTQTPRSLSDGKTIEGEVTERRE
jgi:sec-independent protein translocase protein TatA